MAGDYGYDYETRQAADDEPRVQPQKKGRLRRFGGFLSTLLTLALVIAVVAGVAVFYTKTQFEASGPVSEDTQFSVASGQGLTGIAKDLETRGFVTDYRIFVAGVLFHDAKSKLKAGEFLLPKGASMQKIMETLVSGRSVQHKLSVPEGMTSLQAVARMRNHPILTGEIDEVPAEGSLLPDTYVFLRGVSRSQLIKRMQEAQQKAIDALWEKRQPGLPVKTKEEAIILASIVEKETAKAGERPHVASVFVNRLRKGIKLQSDPTIIYGIVGGKGVLERRLLRSDISRKTAYNTYQIRALPPGPIANPGYAAIEAVLNPMDTKDLYFVADGTGGHAFARTLAEHNRNVAKWRKIEAKRRSLAASKAALARKEKADDGVSAGDQAPDASAADKAEAGARKTATPAPPPAPPAPPSVEPTAPAETGTTSASSSVTASSARSSASQVPASPSKPEAQAPQTPSVPDSSADQQIAAVPADPSTVGAGTRPAAKAFPIPRPKPLRPKSEPGVVTNSEPDAGAKPVASESRAAAPVAITPPAAKPVRKVKPAPKSRVKIVEPDR